jgi:hypothetical protein
MRPQHRHEARERPTLTVASTVNAEAVVAVGGRCRVELVAGLTGQHPKLGVAVGYPVGLFVVATLSEQGDEVRLVSNVEW